MLKSGIYKAMQGFMDFLGSWWLTLQPQKALLAERWLQPVSTYCSSKLLTPWTLNPFRPSWFIQLQFYDETQLQNSEILWIDIVRSFQNHDSVFVFIVKLISTFVSWLSSLQRANQLLHDASDSLPQRCAHPPAGRPDRWAAPASVRRRIDIHPTT